MKLKHLSVSSYLFIIEIETRCNTLTSTIIGGEDLVEYFKGIPDLIKRLRLKYNSHNSLSDLIDTVSYHIEDEDPLPDEKELLHFHDVYLPYYGDCSDTLYHIEGIEIYEITENIQSILF